MNDDIVLEPSAAAINPVDKPDEAKYQPEQVFEVSPDLKIKPVTGDFDTEMASVQVHDTKPKVISPQPVGLSSQIKPIKPATSIKPMVPAANLSSSVPGDTFPGISSIRTYEGDIANLMKKKGTSKIDMVMAENKKETGQKDQLINKEPRDSKKKSLMAVFSLLLILVGVAGAYYLYSLSPLAPATSVEQRATPVASVVPSDSQKIMAVDGLNDFAILSKIQSLISSPGVAGTIEEIIPYTTVKGVKTRPTTSEMIKIMKIQPPNMLERSLSTKWMLGIYADKQKKKSVFVVVTNNFFQNAFAGMLAWESVMSDDLRQYIYNGVVMGIASTPASSTYSDPLQNLEAILPPSGTTTTATSTVASTTVTSTTTMSETPVVPYFTLRGQFVDRIIRNKDVREFVTVNGDVLFLYSFVDNQRLVIASNEAVLTEIIARLEKQAFIR